MLKDATRLISIVVNEDAYKQLEIMAQVHRLSMQDYLLQINEEHRKSFFNSMFGPKGKREEKC